MTSNGQAAELFWTTTGTHANGQPLEYDGAGLLVFDAAGKIARFAHSAY